MPTYEYRCLKCKKKFEKLQSMTEPPVKACPRCGGKPERLISAGAGLIFKGTGFYITDYKRERTADSRQDTGKNKNDAPNSSQKTQNKKQKNKT